MIFGRLRSVQRLRQMRGLDLLTSCQISYRPCQFQDAMISPGRQIHLTHRRSHQTLTLILQLAKLPYLPDMHIRVTNNI